MNSKLYVWGGILLVVLVGVLLFFAMADRDTTSGKTYTNKQAYFSLRYPSNWLKESLPSQGTYEIDRIYGPEGNIDVTWGSGLGGACSENGQEKALEQMTFNGHQFEVCHVQHSDGSESWTQISRDLGGGAGFTASAYAKPPADQNSRVVISILSTLTFEK